MSEFISIFYFFPLPFATDLGFNFWLYRIIPGPKIGTMSVKLAICTKPSECATSSPQGISTAVSVAARVYLNRDSWQDSSQSGQPD